jgi:hypothetical protein
MGRAFMPGKNKKPVKNGKWMRKRENEWQVAQSKTPGLAGRGGGFDGLGSATHRGVETSPGHRTSKAELFFRVGPSPFSHRLVRKRTPLQGVPEALPRDNSLKTS